MNIYPLDHLLDERVMARLTVLGTALTSEALASGCRIPVLENDHWLWLDKTGTKIYFDEPSSQNS